VDAQHRVPCPLLLVVQGHTVDAGLGHGRDASGADLCRPP
jgi:hypothetical protein